MRATPSRTESCLDRALSHIQRNTPPAALDLALKQNWLALQGQGDILMMEPAAHLAGDLPRFAASIQGTAGSRRTEFRELPSTTMQGFSFPGKQAFLIDTIVDWFDGSIPSRDGDRVAGGEVLDGA